MSMATTVGCTSARKAMLNVPFNVTAPLPSSPAQDAIQCGSRKPGSTRIHLYAPAAHLIIPFSLAICFSFRPAAFSRCGGCRQ